MTVTPRMTRRSNGPSPSPGRRSGAGTMGALMLPDCGRAAVARRRPSAIRRIMMSSDGLFQCLCDCFLCDRQDQIVARVVGVQAIVGDFLLQIALLVHH